MRIVVAAATLALLTACGSGSSSEPTAAPATTSSVAEPTSEATTRPPCPNPEGQFCLGKLDAGTYGTVQFQPAISYTVSAGWSNFEDMAGNFLLVPPTGNLKGVDGGTSDFIGVYRSVVAHANACPSAPAPGVGTSPAAIMKWLQRDPAFRASPPEPVTVGGLSGFVTTLRIAPSWKMTCPYSHGLALAPLIVGSSSTFLDHNLIPGQATRLYLLDSTSAEGQPTALAIEVVDIKDAGHLAAYSKLVDQLHFDA
jgi:hypothetical protein